MFLTNDLVVLDRLKESYLLIERVFINIRDTFTSRGLPRSLRVIETR